MTKLFIFAIGGTGERVLRSLTMVLASGAPTFDNYEVYPIIVDYDTKNKDKERTVELLQNYAAAHNAAFKRHSETSDLKGQSGQFFAAKLWNLFDQKNPYIFPFGPDGENTDIAQNEIFADHIDYSNLNGSKLATKRLLTSLYDESGNADTELNLDMVVGFKGNPNIGSVVFHNIGNTDKFRTFLSTYDPANGDKVVIIGSLFGGTGASGIPEIVKAIGTQKPGAKPAAILVLPYFAPMIKQGGAIQASRFNSKTKAALSYYKDSQLMNKIDKLYYIGDLQSSVISYSEGGSTQENNANMVELIAAMMIEHYVAGRGGNQTEFKFAVNADLNLKKRLFIDDFDATSKIQVLNHLVELAIGLKFYHDEIHSKNAKGKAYYKLIGLEDAVNEGADVGRASDLRKLCTALEEFYSKYQAWLKELDFEGNGDTIPANSHRLGLCDMGDEGKDKNKKRAYSAIILQEAEMSENDSNEVFLKKTGRLLGGKAKEKTLTDDFLNTRMDWHVRDDANGKGHFDAKSSKLREDHEPEWVFADILHRASVDGFNELTKPTKKINHTTMANYFTIEKSGNAAAPVQPGIVQSCIDPASIEDKLTEHGAALGKMGSSIPSPMARLFLFSAALREVNNLQSKDSLHGHEGVPDEKNKIVPTPYHELVGELLDMLEFIFMYGDDPKFHILKWDVETECMNLEASGNSAHERLASALRSAFSFGPLQGQHINLIIWGGQVTKNVLVGGSVIGGTSPISLVYTSPNLDAVLQNSSLQFKGYKSGAPLFNHSARPLHVRSKAFREYLFRLRSTDMLGVGDPLKELSAYIKDSMASYSNDMREEINAIDAEPDNYHGLKLLMSRRVGGAPVVVNGIQMRVKDRTVKINPETSGYILAPTVDFFKHGDPDAKTPLALTENGVSGLKYVDEVQWEAGKHVIPPILSSSISDRVLPGIGAKYPYLTVDDFFEEKVIKVSYRINRKKFFIGSGTDISFLLPLKKTFFEYFKLSDLFNANGNYTNMLSVEHDEDSDSLMVRLNLPLVNNKTISFEKEYDTSDGSSDVLNCAADKTFDLAVFPFYRLEPDTSHNVYNVMVGSKVDSVKLEFFESGAIVNSVKAVRTINPRISTEHIHVDGAFSYIELSVTTDGEEAKGLIIPMFKKVNSNAAAATSSFAFSIDFGTSNTHVCCLKSTPGIPLGKKNVVPFEYGDADCQMVELHNEDGPASLGAFVTELIREFVPAELGDGKVKFPIRTATYQADGTPVKLEMFFNSNIGFNYGEDISQSKNYKTNIKWDWNDPLATDRMSTFFTQILWMMKNKSVLNDGADKFRLVVTYPIAMRETDLENFKKAWRDAKAAVQCNVDIRYLTESVAPYYSFLANLNYGDPYVNMDIGGGTTDILYVDPTSGESHVFSAFFAANDLWNDGIDPAAQADKANGFLKFYQDVMGNRLSSDTTDVIERAYSSADIISYLFANDDNTRLSRTVLSSPVMRQLLVAHFSALVFYMAYCLHTVEVDPPRKLSFTGMGSKYIRLISSGVADISKIVNAIFHYVGDVLENQKLKDAAVTVTFAPNPKEVTATGALVSLNYAGAIGPNVDSCFGFEDEDPEKTMRYADITPDVEDAVLLFFKKFMGLFSDIRLVDVLSDIGCNVSNDVVEKLRHYAMPSFRQMKAFSSTGQAATNKLKEPMFFWPMKNSLYIIGKELAVQAKNEKKAHS